MSSHAVLPPPEVDILKTSWFRSFAPGSGGPHVDTLLHNQATIMLQLQDLRRLVSKDIKGVVLDEDQTLVKKITANKVMMDMLQDSMAVYKKAGGVMVKTRTARVEAVAEAWATAMKLAYPINEAETDEEDDEEEGPKKVLSMRLHKLTPTGFQNLHMRVAKRMSITKPIQGLKRKRGEETPGEEEEADEDDEDGDVLPASRQRKR